MTDDYISLQAIVGVIIDETVKVVSTQAVLVSLINSLQELSKLKAVQEMQEEDEVFLSRVFTVPKTERGKEYGRHFILKTQSESSPYFLGIRAR